MKSKYLFNRLEFAGALGDLGTLLPLAIGLILINGLSPTGLFLSVGLFYIFSGNDMAKFNGSNIVNCAGSSTD